MIERTLQVPEIHCEHCQVSIEGAVGKLPGVESVKVDVPARTVDVSFDGESTTEDDVVAAIEDQGYEVPR